MHGGLTGHVLTNRSNLTKNSGSHSGLVSFEDMLKEDSEPKFPVDRPTTPTAHLMHPDPDPGKRYRARQKEVKNDVFEGLPGDGDDEQPKREPVMIEVKPLPKIRLSLMPSPREEDEDADDDSSSSPIQSKNGKTKKKKKKSSRRSSSSTWKKSGRSRK